MNKKTVKVYDTFTGKMVEIEVSQEIYQEYMRTEWGIKNNDNSFFDHEIQFSQLVGGDEGAFENFREFIIEGDPTADYAILTELRDKVRKCFEQMKAHEVELLIMIFFEDLTEDECAARLNTSRQNIHNKKVRFLAKFTKLYKTL
ncbi:MAG: hypothetical protein IJ555_15360 [Ruminococcus sp.]|nr:hypothetical protein [Ruminococcus sp.]MBR1385164.1 hypothetical protein [Ruminococcus sp.]MBR1763970.1 hypothetical protein [Ruminococcus sp.]